VIGLVAALTQFLGCAKPAAKPVEHAKPATIEKMDGSEISRVTLSEDAMKRLDVKTSAVTEAKTATATDAQIAVPYSALIYDPKGKTWVYTNPQPRVFVRAAVEVSRIEKDLAYLSKGPQPGTNVATVGVAELYGTEFTVGH
jgi:hypothetical protein